MSLAVGDVVTVIHGDQPVRAEVEDVWPNSFGYLLDRDGAVTRGSISFDSEGWAWARGCDEETSKALAAAWALRDRQVSGASGMTTMGWR